jgi:tRNA pseudouridine55 synthase
VTLDQLAALSEEARGQWLLAPDTLLQSLPACYLADDAAAPLCRHGNPVSVAGLPGRYRVYAEDRLLGLGELDEAAKLQPRAAAGRAIGSSPCSRSLAVSTRAR